MRRFSGVWYWVLIAIVVVLAASITILFGEANDVPVLEETNSPDTPKETDPVTEDKLQPGDSAPRDTTVNVDPSTKVELQQLFNELRKEYLDTRAKSIDWWLEFIAIFLTIFAVVIAIAGFIGFREFRRLRNEASKQVAEIRKDRAESNELMKNMRQEGNAEVFDMLSNNEEFVQGLRDLLQNSELSVIDKAIADASALQQDGAIEDAIEKWRSIANMVEETDNDLAYRAWMSVGYLHSQVGRPEEIISACNKAIRLKPDSAEAYNNRGAANGEIGQYDAAITDLDKAIRLDPTHVQAFINRGNSRARLGQYDAAITDLDEAIILDPDDAVAYYNRGCIKFLLGVNIDASVNLDGLIHLENAKSDFQTALDLAIQQELPELKTDIEEMLYELNNVE